jgi:hypothetical protein
MTPMSGISTLQQAAENFKKTRWRLSLFGANHLPANIILPVSDDIQCNRSARSWVTDLSPPLKTSLFSFFYLLPLYGIPHIFDERRIYNI